MKVYQHQETEPGEDRPVPPVGPTNPFPEEEL